MELSTTFDIENIMENHKADLYNLLKGRYDNRELLGLIYGIIFCIAIWVKVLIWQKCCKRKKQNLYKFFHHTV
ncbi:TPA_asm: P6 [Trifolium betacytorhabdovirus 1]|nr:TPA_asm: P6 [Trifolium betacytorhabdovirus 1]